MSEPMRLGFRIVQFLAASRTKTGSVVVTTRMQPETSFRATNLLLSKNDGERLLTDLLGALVQNRSDVDRLLKETLQRCNGPLGARTNHKGDL